MKRNTKNILKKVGATLLAVGVVAGTAAGAKALYDYSHSELKTIHPLFNVGGLDTNGEYVDQDTTLYSNEFLAQGLEIKLDFDNDIKYQIFYYESDGDFIESTEVLEDDYVMEEDSLITHARVMIIPQWTNLEATEDKTLEELQVVNWKNKHSFVNQMEIKVNKEQYESSLDVLNNQLINKEEVIKNKGISVSGSVVDNDNLNYIEYKFKSSTLKNLDYDLKITYPNIPEYLDEGSDEPNNVGVSELSIGSSSVDFVAYKKDVKEYVFDVSQYFKGIENENDILKIFVNFNNGNKPVVEFF